MAGPVFTKTAISDGVVYDQPVRVRQIFIKTDGSGSPRVQLYDNTTATGTAILDVQLGTDTTENINIPDNGLRVTNQLYADLTNVTRITFFLS